MLAKVYEITARHDLLVLNVFHAGDGNLHPLLVYDAREPGVMERVHAAGEEIVRVSVEAGGVLSGEHGIGLEKRDLMPLMFSAVDLAAQAALRDAFDPAAWPTRARCCRARPAAATSRSPRRWPRARGSDGSFAEAVGTTDPVTIAGLGRRAAARCPGVRAVAAPVGIDWIQPAEMTVSVGAGTPVDELDAALARARPAGGAAAGRARSAARWRSGAAGSAASATARSATPCCRCATSRPPARSSRAAGRR